MFIKTDPNFISLCDWFSRSGRPLFLVGGAVRNALLNLPGGDNDVCAAYPASETEKLSGNGFSVSQNAYGLGTLVISSDDNAPGQAPHRYEYTAFRKDSYGRGGMHRPEFVTFTQDIKEDASRRDFTINALYAGREGDVTDPLNLGVRDLENRTLRACSDTTLTQDALRILRMVRFSCELGFAIEESTWQAAKANVSGLADISSERIFDEFVKILLSDTRYGVHSAVLKGLEMLYDLGALEYIIPELLEGDGFIQSPKYHKYDVMRHAFNSCAAAPPDLTLRLSALLHDISKPQAFREDGNMYRHAQLGAHASAAVLARLKAPNALTEDVSALVAAHMFDLDNKAKRNTVKRMVAAMGLPRFQMLSELRKADFTGSGMGAQPESAEKWARILREMERDKAPIDLKSLNFTGNDVKEVLGIGEGRIIGEVLRRLHDYALKKPSQNDYQKLSRYAKIVYAGLINKAEDSSGV